MLRLICQEETTLKEFTENQYAQASFFWNRLLKDREIKVNGKKVGENVVLKFGDEICYYLTKKQEEKPAFYTVYEDGNVLVVDKESGVNSEAVFSALQRERECYFIHRLDRNTSGLMVFALTKKAEEELLTAFKERWIEKVYHTVCFGSFAKKTEVLTAYLEKDQGKSLVRVYDNPKVGAETIITEYEVLDYKDGLTKLKVVLHTGKTHQIRAHFAHLRKPIVGDMKYGDTLKNKELGVARQKLVAYSLKFDHFAYLKELNGKIFYSRFETDI